MNQLWSTPVAFTQKSDVPESCPLSLLAPSICVPRQRMLFYDHSAIMEDAMRHLLTALCLAIACSPCLAADTPKKEPTEKQKAQQQRMTDCNAKAKGMEGDKRKDFMKGCLAGKDAPASTGKSTQQDKM